MRLLWLCLISTILASNVSAEGIMIQDLSNPSLDILDSFIREHKTAFILPKEDINACTLCDVKLNGEVLSDNKKIMGCTEMLGDCKSDLFSDSFSQWSLIVAGISVSFALGAIVAAAVIGG